MIYHKTYPTGRKHCSACKRWRPITDFSVRTWLNEKKEIPASFSSSCRVCDARRTRGPNGKACKFHYRWKTPEYQRQKKIEDWENTKKDPVRLARSREYHRFWSDAKRREAGKPVKPNKGPLVYLVATEYGAQRLYYRPGENGRPVVNWRKKIVDPTLADVGSQDSSSSS